MTQLPHQATDLKKIYETRFAGRAESRERVWRELARFFGRWIPRDATVLDLGCGYCEFINALQCEKKIAMDLNPDAERYASSEVSVLQQNCAQPWGVPSESLDVVFSSNFFEHLPSKPDLEQTLGEAHRALRPGGRLIAMGPNIKYLPGKYWDLFDHYLPLTELSLSEVLKKCGFKIEYCRDRFLPYTMSNRREYPTWTLQAYLSLPVAWRFFGKQFLVIASKH
jgi:SAM-dependent methyltransferase